MRQPRGHARSYVSILPALSPRARPLTHREPAPATDFTPPPRRHARTRPALLLGVFFLSLYLLTMGGHLDSPDEELMFQVTRSLAERGALDLGDTTSPERLAFAGADGRTFAP